MFLTENQVRSALNDIVTKCKEVTKQALSASSFVLSELNRVQQERLKKDQERLQKDQEHEGQLDFMRGEIAALSKLVSDCKAAQEIPPLNPCKRSRLWSTVGSGPPP